MKRLRAIIAAQLALLLSWCSTPMPAGAEELKNSNTPDTYYLVVVMMVENVPQWRIQAETSRSSCYSKLQVIRSSFPRVDAQCLVARNVKDS